MIGFELLHSAVKFNNMITCLIVVLYMHVCTSILCISEREGERSRERERKSERERKRERKKSDKEMKH